MKDEKRNGNSNKSLAIGLSLGLLFGVVLDHLALGLCS